MKSIRLFIISILMLGTCLVLSVGCNAPHIHNEAGDVYIPDSSGEDSNLDDSQMLKNDYLFESENSGSSPNGVFKFLTSDINYLTNSGYTIWSEKYTNNSSSFEGFSARVCKESGATEAGYGIVFCSQQNTQEPYLLTVLINGHQKYCIGKVKNGIFSYIENWTTCENINSGIGINNTLSVSYDEQNEKFILKINNVRITDFTVSDSIVFENSKMGYVAVISYNEHFPNIPVKVIYERK